MVLLFSSLFLSHFFLIFLSTACATWALPYVVFKLIPVYLGTESQAELYLSMASLNTPSHNAVSPPKMDVAGVYESKTRGFRKEEGKVTVTTSCCPCYFL